MQQVHEKYLRKFPTAEWRYDLRIRYLPPTLTELRNKDKVTFSFYYEQVSLIQICNNIFYVLMFFLGKKRLQHRTTQKSRSRSSHPIMLSRNPKISKRHIFNRLGQEIHPGISRQRNRAPKVHTARPTGKNQTETAEKTPPIAIQKTRTHQRTRLHAAVFGDVEATHELRSGALRGGLRHEFHHPDRVDRRPRNWNSSVRNETNRFQAH